MLNDFASILWDAIDTYPAEADLILLATEARPSDADSLPKAVQDLLDTLLAKEFLVLA